MTFKPDQRCPVCRQNVRIVATDEHMSTFIFQEHYKSLKDQTVCPNSGKRMTPTERLEDKDTSVVHRRLAKSAH